MPRFVFQTVSVGGVHANATIIGTFHPLGVGYRTQGCSLPLFTAELARRYKTEGINAYVDLIQNKERELGVDIITHQKWSVSSPSSISSSVAHMRQNTGVEPITSTGF